MNLIKIWGYALFGLVNAHKRLPPKTIIVMHGSWVGKDSESFLHAHTVAKLYKNNKDRISFIVASGYDASSDSQMSEGKYMDEILIKNGVPREIILLENKALTTSENIVRSIYLLKEKGVDPNRFNIIPIHRPSYIWKTYYLWNLLGYQIFMAIASAEPFASFLKNAKRQHENIDDFLKDPVGNEVSTAQLRSKTRTHFDIRPLTEDEIRSCNVDKFCTQNK